MFKTYKNQTEIVFWLLIFPPFPFAPVLSPLWGCCRMWSSPQRGSSFSIVNVSNWTSGPCFFLQLIQSPVKSSFPLRFPSLKWKQSEVTSHWERDPSTHFFFSSSSFPLTFLVLTPGSILIQYQERQTLPRVIYKRWSNLQTSSKLHRVMSSHFSVHFCTFHPRPVDLRVWTRNKQCGSISWIAPLLEMEKKVAGLFLSLFPVCCSPLGWHWLRRPESRRYTGFHCAPIGEGEKEREWDRGRKRASELQGGGGRRAGELSPEAPWWKAGATARASEAAGAGKGERRGPPSGKKWRIPKPAHLGVGARSSHSGSARAGRRYVGEIPQPLLDCFTSPKWCRNSRPVDVFSLPDLRYAPRLHPSRISLSFFSMLSMTPLGTLARAGWTRRKCSWVSEREA